MSARSAPPHGGDTAAPVPPPATAVIDERGIITGWSPEAQRLLGHTAREVIGRQAGYVLVSGARPPFGRFPGGENQWCAELSVRHRDGHVLPLVALGCRFIRDGPSPQWLLTMAPPGRFLPLEEERAILEWLFDLAPVALAVYGSDLRCVRQNAAMARLTGVSDADCHGKHLAQIMSGPGAEAWEQALGQVLRTGRPTADEEIHARTSADPDHDHIFRAWAAPFQNRHGRVLGVCTTASDVTERYRARERLVLLNEASTRIGSTLEVMRTAQELADVTIPRLADWVNVDLLETMLRGDEPGPFTGAVALRRAANQSIHEGAPEALRQRGEVDFYPPHSPAVRCMATGRSIVHRVTDPITRSWLADDPVRAEAFREHDFQSIMTVPIAARGAVLGVTVLLRRTKQPFTDDDLLLAEELVTRAAVCLDNARRFARERTAALTLQRNLLPKRHPPQAAVEAASRYLPAGGGASLGGDWFDVIPLSGARVGLVVGDVVGHGINAAAAMGRLRTAVRTLADVDLPPEEMLAHIDDLVIHLAAEDEDLNTDVAFLGATCVYAVYDPASRICTIARAGHPPPAVVTPDGKVTLLDLPAGPPLGLGNLPFEPLEVDLAEGSLLVLYTDGLINTREGDLDDKLAQLRRALANPASPLEVLCDTVLADLLRERTPDDVALVIARTRALDADRVAVLALPADPSAVADARSWATRQLTEWGMEDASFVTTLVVSELVTNAIRHARPPLELRLIQDRTLICEVTDASSTTPHMRRARPSDEGGRGLLLVAQLTERWGTRHTREGRRSGASNHSRKTPPTERDPTARVMRHEHGMVRRPHQGPTPMARFPACDGSSGSLRLAMILMPTIPLLCQLSSSQRVSGAPVACPGRSRR